jgi:hypothetical protein
MQETNSTHSTVRVPMGMLRAPRWNWPLSNVLRACKHGQAGRAALLWCSTPALHAALQSTVNIAEQSSSLLTIVMRRKTGMT